MQCLGDVQGYLETRGEFLYYQWAPLHQKVELRTRKYVYSQVQGSRGDISNVSERSKHPAACLALTIPSLFSICEDKTSNETFDSCTAERKGKERSHQYNVQGSLGLQWGKQFHISPEAVMAWLPLKDSSPPAQCRPCESLWSYYYTLKHFWGFWEALKKKIKKNKFLLCCLGWPWTRGYPLASASQLLGLWAWADRSDSRHSSTPFSLHRILLSVLLKNNNLSTWC